MPFLYTKLCHAFGKTTPKFTLVVRDPVVLRKLILKRNPITLVDAYFHGLVDFEGDLYAGLRLKPYLQKLSLPIRSRAALTAIWLAKRFTTKYPVSAC